VLKRFCSAAVTRHRPLSLRPSTAALAVATGLLACLAATLVDATRSRGGAQRQACAALVRDLGLTDLVLVTEARYLRHLALADRHTAFQDHPLALEHFPAGSVIGVPVHLRRVQVPSER
jgi:hypothetical protein